VTAAFANPFTVAVKGSDPLSTTVAVKGVTAIDTGENELDEGDDEPWVDVEKVPVFPHAVKRGMPRETAYIILENQRCVRNCAGTGKPPDGGISSPVISSIKANETMVNDGFRHEMILATQVALPQQVKKQHDSGMSRLHNAKCAMADSRLRMPHISLLCHEIRRAEGARLASLGQHPRGIPYPEAG
jgi:hypothetical protein